MPNLTSTLRITLMISVIGVFRQQSELPGGGGPPPATSGTTLKTLVLFVCLCVCCWCQSLNDHVSMGPRDQDYKI